MSEQATAQLLFTVFGKPAQMGSKKAFVVGTRAIITDDNSKKRKSWANAVAAVAAESMLNSPLLNGPVKVVARFYFARPQGHFRTGRHSDQLKDSAPARHSQSPDLDKLVRCLYDAMTGIVYRDDRQICIQESSRHWTTEQECCVVEVTEI